MPTIGRTQDGKLSWRIFLSLCCALVCLLVACSSRKMTTAQFRKLKPFKGRVTEIEEISWKSDERRSTMCGPDYRVTISRSNGPTIIIPRFHSLLGANLGGLEKLTNKAICDLPTELVEHEHKHGDQ